MTRFLYEIKTLDHYTTCKANDLVLQFTPPNNTTTPSNALQFPNATDNALQPSLTSNLNATLRFTDEQDDRPILGDDSEGSKE
ncbi:MAG: hypothetical protein PV347_05465 [Rickettsiaceae bacterium]|nr:hypothetical protein [Rickettsiaceae bacterium]MDD9337362.1 hypothetical protein [Rickettsiaceae bacterium]